ncbi:MAG: ATP-dependent RecD-like DNA helicase [Victivallaceae bacterium]
MADEPDNSRFSEVRGEVLGITYRNPENGYAIITVADADGEAKTLAGVLPELSPGEQVAARGVWENSNYGLRLKVDSLEYVLPTTREGLERYLGSGLIPGVGPKLAKSIVEYFGDRTIEILDTKPGRLREIEKIGAKKATKIIAGWRAAGTRRRDYIFFQGLGLTPQFILRLFDHYGDDAAQAVRRNPYKLADDLGGVGFLKADKIALNMGVAPNAPARLIAGLVFQLNRLTEIGHSCFPRERLMAEAAVLLRADPAALEPALDAAVKAKQVVLAEDMVYPARLYRAENELPTHLARLTSAAKLASAAIAGIAPGADIMLNPQQLAAIETAAKSAVSIVTGGPGVGKTTVLGELVRRAKAAKLKILLCAPTGRAAKRLAEATGHAAKTIHRLLGFDPSNGGFVHGVFDPLEADLLVVDETSMLDLPLALALFQAVREGTSVVLVGDADQLPSVGPGDVLASLISCGRFPVTRLTEVFRQSARSLIVANAHRVNSGRMPSAPSPGERSDFYWIRCGDTERIPGLIEELLINRIPRAFGLDPRRDVQLLSPMNRGSCGAVALNAMLQNLLNRADAPQIRRGDGFIKLGDKVMQRVNNYDKSVFNGDLGFVTKIDWKEHLFTVEFDGAEKPVEYGFDETDQLILAYAVTVHKSQGGEFPAVILPLAAQHFMMLRRNLLYTAMTRARKLMVLIGDEKTVRMAVDNFRDEPRFGNLASRLSEKIGL